MANASLMEPDLKAPGRFFIGGEWVAPSTDAKIEVTMPSTESFFYSVAEAQVEDMLHAVSAARVAFDQGPWPKMSHAERADYLDAMGREMDRRSGEFASIWTGQMGIVNSMARAFTPAGAAVYHYYAKLGREFAFEETYPAPDGEGSVRLVREAVGVVAAIIPWNAPTLLIAYKIAPALIAGCTIVLKASPEAPGEALLMAEIAEKIGLPAGVLNVITADRTVSQMLVEQSDIDKVSFTGSTAAGRQIASTLGQRIARFTLELGGKSAAVILDDYDIGKAARTLAESSRHMNGQVCAALTRIVVSEKRHDEMVEALSAEFGSTKVGDPFDDATQMGPLAMRRQRDRVEQLMTTARREGAQLATGGGRPSHLNRGFYIEPTVFGRVDNHSTIAREEVFGPVLSVIPAADEAQAVEIANDTIYGLNASVFTNDPDRAYSVSRQLRSGSVGHNQFAANFDYAFGGFKQSGIGREGGVEGLRSFLETKVVTLQGNSKPI